jgi:hypothetical protein
MLAQEELRHAKFAEYETDAPDNIWHPEFKQEQLDLMKQQLQAMVSASAPPNSEQLHAPMNHPEIPMTASLQSIPEYELPQPIYDYTQYPQHEFPFQSQLQQPPGMPVSLDSSISRQQFQFVDQAQLHDPLVDGQASTDPRVGVDIHGIVSPSAAMSASQQLLKVLNMPAAGTKTVPVLQVHQGSSSRAPAPLQSA